jgi:hypothetical protein
VHLRWMTSGALPLFRGRLQEGEVRQVGVDIQIDIPAAAAGIWRTARTLQARGEAVEVVEVDVPVQISVAGEQVLVSAPVHQRRHSDPGVSGAAGSSTNHGRPARSKGSGSTVSGNS